MRPFATLALAASLTLGLLGCASTPTEATPTPTVTVTVTVTPKPEPTTPALIETVTPDARPSDWTTELQAVGGAAVVTASETEPGRVEVETTLADPRGDAGSPEALQAIAICEAAVKLGATKVVVYESDGSTWILYGHPSYGNTCTEV